MESFLDRVEREANLEVQRIRTEAQQIVDVLNALQLEVPQELQYILFLAKPVRKNKADHTKRIAKAKAKAEAEYKQTRAEIYGVLRKGPKLKSEVMQEVPRSKYRIRQAATRMKKDGELDFRTTEFQGPSEWFLTERPVTLEQLRDEVVDRKGGDIPLAETQTKLGFQNKDHLLKMLDELADQGIIHRNEDGDIYTNYPSKPTSDLRTLHEKKNYTYVGNAVAGTGRTKIPDSDVKAFLDKVKAQGAKVTLTNGGHIMIKHDGKTITVGKTPSRSGILQDKNRAKHILGLNV